MLPVPTPMSAFVDDCSKVILNRYFKFGPFQIGKFQFDSTLHSITIKNYVL